MRLYHSQPEKLNVPMQTVELSVQAKRKL